MKLIDLKKNIEYQLINTSRPKMTHINGRTWDVFKTIIINYKETYVWADTTWGAYGYFQVNNKWYKTSIDQVDEFRYMQKFILEKGKIKE